MTTITCPNPNDTASLCMTMNEAGAGLGKQKIAHIKSNFYVHNLEFRLISSDRQDRSVKHKNYALTTDKSNLSGLDIQSELYQ